MCRSAKAFDPVNRTEHMVVSEVLITAQVVDPCTFPPDSIRIYSKLDLRIDGADLRAAKTSTS